MYYMETIKGHLWNNSQKSPNDLLKTTQVNTKVDVEQYTPLVFDLNCHKDPIGRTFSWEACTTCLKKPTSLRQTVRQAPPSPSWAHPSPNAVGRFAPDDPSV